MSETASARNLSGLFASWRAALLDLVFPPRCGHCGEVDQRWCSHCTTALRGAALDIETRELDGLSGLASTGIHQGILRDAVHALKYEDTQELAQPLGERLFATIEALNWTFDILIPVPLHMLRLRDRGYNQSQKIGAVLAALAQVPLNEEALQRQRHTRPQVGLNQQERRSNVEGAFIADANILHNRKILLLDDVQTSGATFQSCANAILTANASTVYGLSVTRAVLK